jgi:hypothetical protein
VRGRSRALGESHRLTRPDGTRPRLEATSADVVHRRPVRRWLLVIENRWGVTVTVSRFVTQTDQLMPTRSRALVPAREE